MNIKENLEYAIALLKKNNITEPVLKAKMVLASLTNTTKEYLLINEKEEVDKTIQKKYNLAINKLCQNMPIQYIINKQEFMGYEFYVNKDVLIPQPDTEVLVEEVIDIYNNKMSDRKIQILDLCTGSGAIGISLANVIKNCDITLSDISKSALKVAKKNCKNIVNTASLNNIKILQSDLFQNIKNKFDIIVSNPPYIKTDIIKTLDKEVQEEPILALDGGKDGLEIYRKIINEAYKYLNKDGYLCLEIDYDQKNEVIELLKNNGNYREMYSKKDLAGKERIVICKKEN